MEFGRFIGIDIGAETIKLVEVAQRDGTPQWTRRQVVEHHKEPAATLVSALADWGWDEADGAAVSGRFSRQVDLPRVPNKQAQATAFRFLHGQRPATIVSIGSHGFSVLELRGNEIEVLRENTRCSQGTGNFLRQLVERFDLSIEAASALSEGITTPAPLSGRCPVILKTDMTHLANKGEDRARILAGLYDAVCENVQVLIKPQVSPPDVLLVGGVARSLRIRDHFRSFLQRHGMTLIEDHWDDALFLEAVGCALVAAQRGRTAHPALDRLMRPTEKARFEIVSALGSFSGQVKRMPRQALPDLGVASDRRLILGFDIGSTGSKIVAVDVATKDVVWEAYCNTSGNPVGASQQLMQRFVDGAAARCPVVAFGATGSGREIVGSLLSTAYGAERVYVLNEIAAHAEGALHFDRRVDTIFEIGGQDAKYIRLAGGRVIDAAMNEACSAGTGSFIEEQGRKFQGITDVVHLGQEALTASCGVSLGQHCSVFMAEIIDGAVAAGVEKPSIIAGIYDSIIQNYLNRVKGSRSVGDVIFCQGMPFAADALAAAVVRQTGSEVVIPPNPGTVGALGIALLTRKAVRLDALGPALDPQRFLDAQVARKDTFTCKAIKGCGGAGNRCRIDRISTVVAGEKQRFTWGGGCSLWDQGTGKRKLPDRSPDPLRARQQMLDELVAQVSVKRGYKRVAVTDEFQLKGLFPFFATFIHELGYDLEVYTGASLEALKRGIERANVPFCAPMQHYHGVVTAMAETNPDLLFLPMLKQLEKANGEPHAAACPVVQGSPDILAWDLGPTHRDKIVSPVIMCGRDLESREFTESCARVAAAFGVVTTRWRRAYAKALVAQRRFEDRLLELGREALAFCADQNIVPVVVLGRAYTIYNKVLNSNVPALLREQGAIAIPVDCYPVEHDVPVFDRIYWGHGQRNLRAAHQIRRTPGTYSIWTSNYSCGPDSFNLHFYAYIMAGKPFAVIETDGHSGDAGTKTRVEAFLHCVREDLAGEARDRLLHDFTDIVTVRHGLSDIQRDRSTLLVPRMGAGADVLAASLRMLGVLAEALPIPDTESVRLGRRYTSGKECVPMTITLGSLLQRIERDPNPDSRFTFFMPTANGPCRLGVYHLLHRIVLERLGLGTRVAIWSPVDANYFDDVPAGFTPLVFAGLAAMDVLLAAVHDVRPVELRPGAAQAIYERYVAALMTLIESTSMSEIAMPVALMQVAVGRLFGIADLLRRAAAEFSAIKSPRRMPVVAIVGEIYARCDPFANDFVIEKLEARGIKSRFAPFVEWLEYVDFINAIEGRRVAFGAQLSTFIQRRILSLTYEIFAKALDWPERTRIKDTLAAAAPWIRHELHGEAVLTIGGPVYEWREGSIDGVVSVGPLECMPTKLAESQYYHIAEKEGLLSLTVALNGDPVDPEILDRFAFEIHERYRARHGKPAAEAVAQPASRNTPVRKVV